MPKLSVKAQETPSSPIRRLVPYANAAKQRGVHVFHLNIGQPDIKTPECVLDAVRSDRHDVIAYSESAGNKSYRDGLVQYYAKQGIEVTSDQIMVTNGGSEAIVFAFLACMDPGDEIIIPEPFYANYLGFAYEAGVKIVPVPSSIENDFALPPIEEFEKRITPRTRALAICNPNNPTGYLYTQEEIEQLGAIARKHDLFLFADEVYREFRYGGVENFSILQLKDMDEHTVMMDSVSKRYSLCGVRIGALVTRNKELMAAVMKFAQARLCPPSYGQIAAEAALQTPPSYFQEVYDEYIARRDYMVNALNSMEGVYSPLPRGAFYTVVKLPVDDAEKFAIWMLESFQHKGSTVMFAPASGFYATPGLGRNEARFAYVLNLEDLKLAMEVLAEGLKKYPGRTL